MKRSIYQHRVERDSRRILSGREHRAHMTDLVRFDGFGPEVRADWLAFLSRQPYHRAWLSTPAGQAAVRALEDRETKRISAKI